MTSPLEVCITGIGVVSPLGACPAGIWKRLVDGYSATAPIRRFDASRFSCRLACEIDGADLNFNGDPWAHELRRMDRFVRYAAAAARDAFKRSAILPP